MASFTDQIMQSRPYVQQLPLEAMAQVGMYKQQKYEEGVQKIQGQIDKVAGMDIIRGIDKKYLQSKLNELGGRLKTVAAGDFSNFQLVNSVGGMANQISQDRNIQNALSSTARYRKGLEEMNVARKEGKSSPSNEYVFNMSAKEWMDSENLDRSFGGSYKPYTNWKKEAVEILKAMTKDSTITEDMFTPDGRLSDVTVKTKFAGISPEKIQEALLVGLTPSAMEQMQIDGVYTYANKSPDQFKTDIYNSFKDKADYFIKQKNVLEIAKLNTTSGEEKLKLNNQIASLDKMIDGVTNQYEGLAESLKSGNIDGAKASLFTANQITNFAKAFSFTETEQTYGQNYAAEMAFKREVKTQEWNEFLMKFNQTEKWKGKEYEQEERKIKAAATPLYGGLPQAVPQEDLPKFTTGQIIENVNKTKAALGASDAALVQQYSKDPNKIPTQSETNEWIETQRNKWQEGKADPIIAEYFNTTEPQRRQADMDQEMVLRIERDAKNKKYLIDGKEMSSVDLKTLIPAGTTGLSFKTGGGRTLTFSPEELAAFNAKRSKYMVQPSPSTVGSPGGGVGSLPKTIVYLDQAKRDLSDKEFTLFNIIAKEGPSSSGDKMIISKLQEISNLTTSKFNRLISAQNDYISNEVAKSVTNMQGVSYDFPVAKPEQKTAIVSKLNEFAEFADKQKGKIANSPGFNSGDLRKIASELSSASMTVVEGTAYAPAMYEISAVGKDGLTTKFRVTPEQKVAVFGNLFEASPEVQAFRPYQEMIRKTGTGSTSFKPGPSTWNDSQLGKLDFSNVKSFGVKGDVREVGVGKYSIRLNIRDPRTGELVEDVPWPKNSLATETEVMFYKSQVNDNTAFQLLYNRTPSAAELKEIQKAKDKPF
jgi:hypothetical protein